MKLTAYAFRLVRRVAQAERVTVGVGLVPGNSSARMVGQLPLVLLGRQSLARAWRTGFQEYPGLADLTGHPPPTRWAGIHCLTLHEVAHAVCWARYGSTCTACALHAGPYRRVYRRLLRRFPRPP